MVALLTRVPVRAARRLCGAAAVLIALTLAACSTGYEKLSITGGYLDKKLSADTAVVGVTGNGFASRDKVISILMLRAAELTLEQGYERFSLVYPNDRTKEAEQAGRLPAFLRAQAARGNSGPLMGTDTVTLFNPYTGAVSVNKHTGAAYVVMFKGSSGAFGARKLVAKLRPKLMRKEKNDEPEVEARS